MSLATIKVKDASGKEVAMSSYSGKVLLIVNTASKCGFTPQYEGLQALHEEYHGRGLEVLAFPCNQFGNQEQGSDSEIQEFCTLNYGITFQVFQKVEVNGDSACELYHYLKAAQPGLLGSEAIKWNFTKFLVDRKGQVLGRFAPQVSPISLREAIEQALANI